MKMLISAIIILYSQLCFGQTAYDKAWKAINENRRDEAQTLLSQIPASDPSFGDAYLTSMYLKTYNGKEKTITDFYKTFLQSVPDGYPYIYALWFNTPVLGDYGKKNAEHQLKLLDQMLADAGAPGTIIAAANYQKGMHYLFSNDFDKAQKYYKEVGNIKSWQYVGPFENLSESGIYKNYGPLDHPEGDAIFKSISNADIKWFTPSDEVKDGWNPVVYQFNNRTAVVYAQNFVTSSKDQAVLCNVGVSGAIKVWVNDELVVSELKERVTEIDTYNTKVNLKKGTNRILVQLGYTDMSFPNFIIRFTDENHRALPDILGSATYAEYPKVKSSSQKFIEEPLFAEQFFENKINSDPKNLVNYLLLADVYLRNKKIIEARNLISAALKDEPSNSLLRIKLVNVLLKEDNNSIVQEQIEKIKQSDPESLLVLELKIKELIGDEKYEDAATALQNRIDKFGEDESTVAYKILLLANEKKYDELVKEAEKFYAIFPNNAKVIDMMYSIKKEIYKDNKGAIKLYENFFKNNYDYTAYEQYATKLEESGNNEKALEIKQKLANSFPYSPSGYSNLAAYYFTSKKYDKAEENILKAISLSPYNEYYWEKLGDISNEKGKSDAALQAYNKSLLYNPNQYDIINKIRKMGGKKELYKSFPEADITKLIKDDNITEAKNTDFGYYYILNQKNAIIYPGGANEEYYTLLIKITNEKGVDAYKESSIGYGNTQNLLIEKSEIIKKNQTKVEGERNGNEIVFTNLEVGDVLLFKYRLQSYVYGRFAKEYWDKFFFNGQIYTAKVSYNLLIPKEQKIYYDFSNSDLKPVIQDVENFKQYTWESQKMSPLKTERLMPKNIDVAPVLHISTIKNWNEISGWYSDVTNNKAEEDYEIIAVYKTLFPEGLAVKSQFQKAKIIYEYIQANMRYSSVSFRQSAFVPQRPSTTVITRLGDCKDFSSLFVTLAHMAGINAQMVLVDTRENGQKDILLPSVEFNHCIAKALLDNKAYYIELTDNYLPFASLPNNLNGAAILEIPSKNMDDKSDIHFLKTDHKTRDVVKRIIDIKPVESDLQIKVKVIKYGQLTSGTRGVYLNLDKDKQIEEMEKSIAAGYKNNVRVSEVNFKDLEKLNDSLIYNYVYKVKDEIAEIGSLNTFKISYPDVIASLDNFSSDTRDYPVEYCGYEDTDEYETVVNVTAPEGKKFVELPSNEAFSFGDSKFSIKYIVRAPGSITIVRKFSNTRPQQISTADYPAFKIFFEKIVKAEQKFIAYK